MITEKSPGKQNEQNAEQLTLYVSRELKAKLQSEASRNLRSLNKQALFFLEKGALHLTDSDDE